MQQKKICKDQVQLVVMDCLLDREDASDMSSFSSAAVAV